MTRGIGIRNIKKGFSYIHCKVCKKPIYSFEIIKHHTNYSKNTTVSVCTSCHLKIHRGKKNNSLLPKDKRKDLKTNKARKIEEFERLKKYDNIFKQRERNYYIGREHRRK